MAFRDLRVGGCMFRSAMFYLFKKYSFVDRSKSCCNRFTPNSLVTQFLSKILSRSTVCVIT